jgi:hypothetical protein
MSVGRTGGSVGPATACCGGTTRARITRGAGSSVGSAPATAGAAVFSFTLQRELTCASPLLYTIFSP